MGCGASAKPPSLGGHWTDPLGGRVLLSKERKPQRGHLLLEDLETADEFEIAFDVKPHSMSVGQTNILRVTCSEGNMSQYGDRMPSFSFWPGTQLHVTMGRPGCHNVILDSPPGTQLPVNRVSRVVGRLAGGDFAVFVEGEELCRKSGFERRYPGMADVKVWLSDSFYSAADATVSKLVYRSLKGFTRSFSVGRTVPLKLWAHAPKVDVPRPFWWEHWPDKSSSCGERRVASEEVHQAVQALMDHTWKPVTTRDRDYEPVRHFQVVSVLHNEHRAQWETYCRTRNAIAQKDIQRMEARTSTMADGSSLPPCLGYLECGVNEFLLFHGTNPTAAERICEGGFLISKAGSHKGTLYGAGLYFAENSSKSDEYAGDDKVGIYKGLYAMLLCRVTCGNPLHTEEVEPDPDQLQKRVTSEDSKYHCVLGDREKARGTYREFVVFDSDQAYQEYVVVYRRVAK